MDKSVKIYLILILFTMYTFLVGYLHVNFTIIVAITLFITFIKGHLIIENFMGLKNVKGKYRFIPSIWLGIVISFIGLGYYL